MFLFVIAEKDIEIARYCLDMFKKTNISAFTDLTGILAGEVFLEILQQHIVNCKIFLAIISNSTLKSKYSMREMLYAQKLGKIIIPIVLEDTILDDKYKLHFGYINYIIWNFQDHSTFEDTIIKTIHYHLEKYYRDQETPVQREIDIDREIKILDDYQPKEIDYNVFISYRREGGRDVARSIKLSLELIGYNKFFFDYNSIRDGMFKVSFCHFFAVL